MVAPAIARAADALRSGELVAFPTETVYGLGADASNSHAVRQLFAVKGRPTDHPVIVHISRGAQLDELAREVPDIAHGLAAAFWPGPLTLVVRRNTEGVAQEVTGGRDTVGLRVPDHPIALALLDAFGAGVAAPSANRFGKVSPTTAAHVRADLGADVAVVLDGGACTVGIESTIVDVTGSEPAILRVGGVSRERIEATIGRRCVLRTSGETAAPGTLPSHYSPTAAVETVSVENLTSRSSALLATGQRVAVLAPGDSFPDLLEPLPDQVVMLDSPRDTADYARVLYARLRTADESGVDVLLVVLPPEADGLGAAIADRVHRAAR